MLGRKVELGIGQFYRELTHVRRFNQAVRLPFVAQTQKLMQIMRANENTIYGKRYNFDKVHSIADYQRYVPPTNYEELSPYIEATMNGRRGQLTDEDALMFATTSGTTGKPKYFPITKSHLADYAHAFQIHNYGMIRDVPGAAAGSVLIFSSNDEEGVSPCGIPCGAVSGLLRQKQSPLIQKYFTLPHLVSRIKDVEVKYYTMLRLALCKNVTAICGCNPSSFLLFSDQMKEHAESLIRDIFEGTLRKSYCPPAPLAEAIIPYLIADKARAMQLQSILESDGMLMPKTVWPNLALLSCWKGGPLSFYLDKLPETYGDIDVRDFGYMASEGRGTIPLSSDGAGGVIAVSCHFYEFVPESQIDSAQPNYLTVDQLKMGERYFIHFTTAAGLYRYNINDLVEVVGFHENTPVIQFVQKGLGVSSITGEKLTEEQVQIALCYAVRQLNLTAIEHFTFAVQLALPPHYVCFVELKQELPDSVAGEFLRVFEQSLQHP